MELTNWKVWIGFLLLAGLGVAGYVTLTAGSLSPVTKEAPEDPTEDLREVYAPSPEAQASEKDLEAYDLADRIDESGTRHITGKLRSRSGKKYTYVEVNFTIHDASDAPLGVATANTMGLDAGESWAFSAPVRLQGAVKYRVARTFGW